MGPKIFSLFSHLLFYLFTFRHVRQVEEEITLIKIDEARGHQPSVALICCQSRFRRLENQKKGRCVAAVRDVVGTNLVISVV